MSLPDYNLDPPDPKAHCRTCGVDLDGDPELYACSECGEACCEEHGYQTGSGNRCCLSCTEMDEGD